MLAGPVLAGPEDGGRALVREAWALIEAASILPDVPVTVDLGPGELVGVVGPAPAARALLRSLVLQLVAAHGPADLLVAGLAAGSSVDATGAAAVMAATGEGSWLAWLPHTEDPAGGERLVAAGAEVDSVLAGIDRPTEPPACPHLLLVVEDPSLLAARNTPARRLLSGDPSAAALVVAEDVAALPSACRTVVQLRADGSASIQRPGQDGLAEHVRPAGASSTTARRVALALAGLHDPERPGGGRGLPAVVALTDLRRRPARRRRTSSAPTGAPRATIRRSAPVWRWRLTVRSRSISCATDPTCSWPGRPARARASSSGR